MRRTLFSARYERINIFGRTWVEDQFLAGSLRTQRRYRKRSAFMACRGLKQRRLTTDIIHTQKKLQRTSAVIKHKTTMGTLRIQNHTTADIHCNKTHH